MTKPLSLALLLLIPRIATADIGQELFCDPTHGPEQQQVQYRLKAFTTDACSAWLRGGGSIGMRRDKYYAHCCIVHDIAYWTGGTREQKRAADQALASCIRQETNLLTAVTILGGVTVGGLACTGTRWRWGYGWVVPGQNGEEFKSARKTNPLNDQELRQRQSLLNQAKATALRENPRYFREWCQKVRQHGNRCGDDPKTLEDSQRRLQQLLEQIQ